MFHFASSTPVACTHIKYYNHLCTHQISEESSLPVSLTSQSILVKLFPNEAKKSNNEGSLPSLPSELSTRIHQPLHTVYIHPRHHTLCVHVSEKSLRFLEHLEMQFNSLLHVTLHSRLMNTSMLCVHAQSLLCYYMWMSQSVL